MTSRKRMMSWRAEKRTCRFRGVVEWPAMDKPVVGNKTDIVTHITYKSNLGITHKNVS